MPGTRPSIRHSSRLRRYQQRDADGMVGDSGHDEHMPSASACRSASAWRKLPACTPAWTTFFNAPGANWLSGSIPSSLHIGKKRLPTSGTNNEYSASSRRTFPRRVCKSRPQLPLRCPGCPQVGQQICTPSRRASPASLYVSPRDGYGVAFLETIVGPVAHADATHTRLASTRDAQIPVRKRLNAIGA